MKIFMLVIVILFFLPGIVYTEGLEGTVWLPEGIGICEKEGDSFQGFNLQKLEPCFSRAYKAYKNNPKDDVAMKRVYWLYDVILLMSVGSSYGDCNQIEYCRKIYDTALAEVFPIVVKRFPIGDNDIWFSSMPSKAWSWFLIIPATERWEYAQKLAAEIKNTDPQGYKWLTEGFRRHIYSQCVGDGKDYHDYCTTAGSLGWDVVQLKHYRALKEYWINEVKKEKLLDEDDVVRYAKPWSDLVFPNAEFHPENIPQVEKMIEEKLAELRKAKGIGTEKASEPAKEVQEDAPCNDPLILGILGVLTVIIIVLIRKKRRVAVTSPDL